MTVSETDSTLSLHIPDKFAGQRLDQALAELYSQFSRSRLQQWLNDGELLGDGKSVKANKKVLAQINRSSQRSKLIDKTKNFIKSLDLNSTDTIIGSRQIYTSSMGEGKTAVEKQKKGNAVDEIKKLSEQILQQLN